MVSVEYHGIKTWRQELLGSLEERLGWVEEEEIYSFATLLDHK